MMTYIVDVDRSTEPPTVTVHRAVADEDDASTGLERLLLLDFPVRSISDAARLGRSLADGFTNEPAPSAR